MATKATADRHETSEHETAGETVDVDALVQAEIAHARRECEVQQREAVTAARLQREAAMAKFRAALDTIFPPPWQHATHLTFHAANDNHLRGWATLSVGGVEWRIEPAPFSPEAIFNASADSGGGVQLALADGPDTLRLRLVDQTARIIERDEAYAERERAYAREQERTRAEWEAKCAAIRTVHEACAAEIEAERVAARATAWQWPDGVTLTLYRWEWQKARDEDGNPVMGWGWATTPTLTSLSHGYGDPNDYGDQGSIHLRATRAQPERTINLSYHTHLPCSYTKRFASTAELAHELAQPRTITVDGIADRYSEELDERVYVRQAGATLTLPVDDEPLPWVRAAVEQARQEQNIEEPY